MNYIDHEDFVVNCADRRFTDIEHTYQMVRQNTACRLQIGSYTCGGHFFGLTQWLKKNPLPADAAGYDLVLPVFSESQLDWLSVADDILKCARHIVVNDYGLLRHFSGDKRVRLGRLLFRDYRDHRYKEYETNRTYQAKAVSLINVLREMGYEIFSVENDMITADYAVDLGQIHIYYHFPYRQVSSAHICEFAAIGKPVEKKFIPDDACAFQCFDVKIRHEAGYMKIGRSVFDILPESWLSAMPRSRIIYTPRW